MHKNQIYDLKEYPRTDSVLARTHKSTSSKLIWIIRLLDPSARRWQCLRLCLWLVANRTGQIAWKLFECYSSHATVDGTRSDLFYFRFTIVSITQHLWTHETLQSILLLLWLARCGSPHSFESRYVYFCASPFAPTPIRLSCTTVDIVKLFYVHLVRAIFSLRTVRESERQRDTLVGAIIVRNG